MSRLEDIARRRDRHLIPRHCWDARDWREQRRDSQRSLLYQPSGTEVVVIPKHTIPAGFGGLYGQPSSAARSRAVDKILKSLR